MYLLSQATLEMMQPAEVAHLRRMDSTSAAIWLASKRPDVVSVPEVFADLMNMVEDVMKSRVANKPNAPTTTGSTRPRFVAAAWINGATWGQLASLFGVRRETLLRSVERILPANVRQDLRASRQSNKATYDEVVEMRDRWAAMSDADVNSVSVLELSRIIRADV